MAGKRHSTETEQLNWLLANPEAWADWPWSRDRAPLSCSREDDDRIAIAQDLTIRLREAGLLHRKHFGMSPWTLGKLIRRARGLPR